MTELVEKKFKRTTRVYPSHFEIIKERHGSLQKFLDKMIVKELKLYDCNSLYGGGSQNEQEIKLRSNFRNEEENSYLWG